MSSPIDAALCASDFAMLAVLLERLEHDDNPFTRQRIASTARRIREGLDTIEREIAPKTEAA